jgi:hypothetical protein
MIEKYLHPTEFWSVKRQHIYKISTEMRKLRYVKKKIEKKRENEYIHDKGRSR